ncbi:hypothetical protein pb186bvf_006840 [Paramecium bursaria]
MSQTLSKLICSQEPSDIHNLISLFLSIKLQYIKLTSKYFEFILHSRDQLFQVLNNQRPQFYNRYEKQKRRLNLKN